MKPIGLRRPLPVEVDVAEREAGEPLPAVEADVAAGPTSILKPEPRRCKSTTAPISSDCQEPR
jgi:hypothetical protein